MNEHLWIIFGLGAAVMIAASDALTRSILRNANEYLVAWLRLLYTLPVVGAGLLFAPVPELDREFYLAMTAAVPLEIAAITLYIKALKVSPLSLTVPFLSLTPVFLIVVPTLLIGERLSAMGAAGVLLIAAGGYFLNVKEFRRGLLEPVRAIAREKGALFMIGVAFIYAFTSTLGKYAIEHSSPLFFGAVLYVALFAFFTPLALYKGRRDLRMLVRSGTARAVVAPGLLHGGMVLCHMIGISMTQVAYLISVKRLSLLFSVVLGAVLLKETGLRERLTGASLMFAGFVTIVLLH